MNIKQVELAKLIGCSSRHLNQVFRHNLNPSVKLAKKIQAHTGIPWTSWFEEKQQTPTITDKATP